MTAPTLRLPEPLQNRLKRSAHVNHRSTNKQAVELLLEQPLVAQTVAPAAAPVDVFDQRVAALMAVGKPFAILPLLDIRTNNEIMGHDDYGLPT